VFRTALSVIFSLLFGFLALAVAPAGAQAGAQAGAGAAEPPPLGIPESAPPAAAPPAPPPGRPRVTLESAWLVADETSGQLRVVGVKPPEPAPQRLYTARFRHDGIIVVTGLEIVLEIPAGMRYVVGSATGPGARVTFSVDGGQSFAPPDSLRVATDPADPESAMRRARAREYTHIRYELPGEYPPGTAGLVSFRARPATAPIGDNDAP
jgi:hypothetical protein